MFVCLKIMAAIFYQIVYMSIIASIVGLVILLIQKIINRRISPKCNHYIWLVFIFVLLFPISIPSKFSIYNYIDVSSVKLYVKREVDNKWNKLDIKNEKYLSEFNSGVCINNFDISNIDVRIIIADAFMIISLLKVLKAIISHQVLIYEFGNDEIKDERVLNIFYECQKKLKIRKRIKLINQNIANSPSIIGIFNVKILFTESMLLLDNDSLKSIFMHELSHYKRRDNYLNFVIMILNSVYWFNPIVTSKFKYIKQNIEFSTDELAIKNMTIEETKTYCKTMVEIASMCSRKIVPALGFSGDLSYISKRIDFISLKTKFEKFSKIITTITAFIILIICLMFYPTSYGVINRPRLYLQTEYGGTTEILNYENFSEINSNVITLKENEKAKILINNSKSSNCIYFNKMNINNNEKVTNVLENEMICFEKGENLYNFTFISENKRTFNYIIKIIVE